MSDTMTLRIVEIFESTEKIISSLIPTHLIEVDIMKTTKQVGSNDCGLFAIAIATALAYKTDPYLLDLHAG